MKKETKNHKNGFTLLELLIVVLIIGILAGIALPQYQLSVDKAKYTQAMTLMAAINQAQSRYILDKGNFTTNFYDLDIDMPNSSKIATNGATNNYYFDSWGECWLHNTGYGACAIKIGKSDAWYFLYWDSTIVKKKYCWAKQNDARTTKLCQAVTGKTTGSDNGDYKVYAF